MDLRLRQAIRWMIIGLGVVSLQAGAEVDASKSSLVASLNTVSAQAVDLFALKWGWLIGIVLIALVVVTRSRKAP
jgi:hypothetical protein